VSDKQAKMWVAFEAYQPTADADGHGESWAVMLKERTVPSIEAAYVEAPRGSVARAAEKAAMAVAARAAAEAKAAAEAAMAAWKAARWAPERRAAEADHYAQHAIDAIREVQS